jgi:hypothetical protein
MDKDVAMLAPLLLLATALPSMTPVGASAANDDPPIRVWFNSSGNFAPGDRAKVYAKAGENGYLVVLRVDNAGRVRVLFPLEPGDPQQITGGKKYELKGRGGREAFVADDRMGTVFAAVSSTPFQFDRFVRDGRWDYLALSTSTVREDVEWGLLDLVKQMNPSGPPFEFDLATYVVEERFARDRYGAPYAGFGWWGYDPWWGYGPYGGSGYWLRRHYFGYRWSYR